MLIIVLSLNYVQSLNFCLCDVRTVAYFIQGKVFFPPIDNGNTVSMIHKHFL